jgi:arsenate reductase (glutaredoxin)
VTTTIYGIKNCETMKKARAWLDGRGIAYAFHDYKAAALTVGFAAEVYESALRWPPHA